jgi:hypothetical protein
MTHGAAPDAAGLAALTREATLDCDAARRVRRAATG